jgi:hypothetical protein
MIRFLQHRSPPRTPRRSASVGSRSRAPDLVGRRFLPAIAFVLAAALGIVVACEEADVYVYTAQRYNADAACLEPYKPIEVVNGPGGDLCAPSCLRVNGEIFVSRVCPPVPSNASLLRRDAPECQVALALEGSCDDEEGDGGEEQDEDGGEEQDEDDAGPDAADAASDG